MATQPRKQGVERRSDYEKLAITMPRRTASMARDRVRAGEAQSLSAFIADAVEEKLERDRLQEVLDEIFREQPMTDEERQWADQHLGL